MLARDLLPVLNAQPREICAGLAQIVAIGHDGVLIRQTIGEALRGNMLYREGVEIFIDNILQHGCHPRIRLTRARRVRGIELLCFSGLSYLSEKLRGVFMALL